MTSEERKAEIARLKEAHKDALAVPLMSEGAISPHQVGIMSENQKKRWQAKAQERMEIESQIRLLSRTDEQIAQAEKEERERKISSRLLQIDNMIETMERFTGKNGKTLPKYAREISRLTEEQVALTARKESK